MRSRAFDASGLQLEPGLEGREILPVAFVARKFAALQYKWIVSLICRSILSSAKHRGFAAPG